MVDLAAEVLAALPGMRKQAESLMTDRCVVRRNTGETATDPDTFEVVPVFDVLYAGKAKLSTYDAFESSHESAGATVTTQRSNVHFPVGAFAMQIGDVVTITASVDPLLVGRSYRLAQQAPVKTHATAYRCFVDENIGEEVPPWSP
jgi:hypothetical protein